VDDSVGADDSGVLDVASTLGACEPQAAMDTVNTMTKSRAKNFFISFLLKILTFQIVQAQLDQI
jgi:hypothetical protein